MSEQLTLFDEPVSELDSVWKAIIELKDSHNNVRKRMFSEVKEIKGLLTESRAEVERLKFLSEMKPKIKWNK